MPVPQELRIGLVMNGGVSLAVWMGGVTRELDRLRRGDGVYRELQALTAVRARIDVIAGASAGGINGAILALAIARGTTVEAIRDLWMTRGSIADLLRDPLVPRSPSLLQGDAVLLTGLREALAEVAKGGVQETPAPPLHLTITGTSLTGQVKGYVDHFGEVIPDIDHRLRFQFRRGPVGDPPPRDDFARDDAVDQLALAARSSASFPGAFEPSWCPADRFDPAHPGMREVAGLESDRWVIDGGVLVNTPFLPALDAISTLPAEGPVRRVLAYVVPHLVPEALPPDRHDDEPPGRAIIAAALSRLPRVQSISHELEAIQESNRQADRRRDARAATLGTLSGDQLEAAATTLLPSYLESRRKAVADDISMLVLDARAPRDTVRLAWREAPDPSLPENLRATYADAAGGAWVPDQPSAEAAWLTLPIRPWHWGLAPVEHAGNVALDSLRRAVGIPELAGDEEVLRLRRALYPGLAGLRGLRRESDGYWAGPHAAQSSVAASGWQDTFGERLGDFADAFAGLLVDLRARLVPVEGKAAADLRNALDTLVSGPAPGLAPLGRDDVVRRLLALDVVQRSAGADLAGVEQRIELVLVSADAARNAFRAGAPVEHKLAGLQAGHFGAFYKQSWRANDWMWGRLDGADRLVRTLVDPKRLQPMPPQERFDQVRAIACGGAHAEYLESQWEAEPVRAELGGDLADDAKLEATYAALARRVQLEIVMEELPRVRLAVDADVDAGGARGKGADWAARHPGELDAARAVQAFKVCDVGAETLPGEVGSDQFTRVSTQGIAVAGSFLSTSVPAKPPKLVQALLATVRGALLALYLLAKGVLMRTRSAGFAAQAVLAAGAVLLALALLGAGIPGIFAVIGAVLIVDGFALAALQRQGWRIVLVLLAFAVAVGGYYGIREWSGRPAVVDSLAAVVAVGIMALAAMTLGLAARSKASPADSSDTSSAS